MLYAVKIRMNYRCWSSQHPADIAQIYINGWGWRTKEYLHDYLKKYPGSIAVNLPPYPRLIPDISSRGERYVRSNPNPYLFDNLLNLPVE